MTRPGGRAGDPAAPDLAALRDAYRRDGHVSVAAAVDAETVAAALHHLAALQAGRPGPPAIVTAPLDDPGLAGLAADARLRRLAGALLGAEPAAFGATYVVKPPRTGLPALWHQDGHPWRAALGLDDAVTLWLALDPADAGNGCLRVVPGSHRRPARPLRPSPGAPSLFGHDVDVAGVDLERAVDVVLAPGDVSAHHLDLVHGSGPNRSPRPRRALALRYRPAG